MKKTDCKEDKEIVEKELRAFRKQKKFRKQKFRKVKVTDWKKVGKKEKSGLDSYRMPESTFFSPEIKLVSFSSEIAHIVGKQLTALSLL